MNKVKQNIRILENYPEYNPNIWKPFLNAGCYPYVLDLRVDKFFLVGDLIGKRCNSLVSDEYLIEVIKEELGEIFDYELTEVDTQTEVKEFEKKIYLQREQRTGYYHFLRQDNDGIWSHKFPNELPVRIDSIGQLVTDPDEMVEAAFDGWCFGLKKRN